MPKPIYGVYHPIILIILCILLASCSSKPQIYPNAHFKKVGQKQADHDIKRCQAKASKFLKTSKAKKIMKSGVKTSIIGASFGASVGLLSGNFAQNTAEGAASGAAAGATRAAISPDRLKRRYVNHCLEKKGYKVIGWD
jgi:tRNA U34 5-carboxymethylaminomethyl modifying GTPase MnmE/TrmE